MKSKSKLKSILRKMLMPPMAVSNTALEMCLEQKAFMHPIKTYKKQIKTMKKPKFWKWR